MKQDKYFPGTMEWYKKKDDKIVFCPGILANHLSKSEPVIYAAHQFYAYDGGVYKPITDFAAQRTVQMHLIPESCKMAQITDAAQQWRLQIYKQYEDLNPNPYRINTKNGLYDVETESLEPHDPAYLSTVQLPVAYSPRAECPRFRQFLQEIMDGQQEQIDLLQEMLGYMLIPLQSAQKCFVLVGAAGAGKSVLLRVVTEILLGTENVSNVSWQALNERFKTAELYGKLANVFADLPSKGIDDNGIFKSLVGEDSITVEKKNKDPFSFRNYARLLFSCNAIPRNLGDRSDGFFRRLIIIRFNKSVPPEKRDPYLLDKLKQEADGIFLFALEGLKRLIANRFHFSENKSTAEALQQYKEESDSILSYIRERCLLYPGGVIASNDLYASYKLYCDECGLKPFAMRTFIQEILENCPNVEKGVSSNGRYRILKGIFLRHVLD